MSKKRYIRDEMWNDDWFFDLSTEQKLVWIFLLTNERCNVAGVYKLNRQWAAGVVGVEKNVFDATLDAFSDAKKILLVDQWVIVINFVKHQADNPSVKQGISRILKEVPQEVTDCIQRAHSEGTDCSTLLNLTLLNFTLPNGDSADEFFEESKHSEDDLRLANLLADLIKGNNPDWQLRGKIETWAEHVEKMRRIDKRTPQQIEYMIRWTQAHDFWQANILSTAKLRIKFNDLIPQVKREAVKNHRSRAQAAKPKML